MPTKKEERNVDVDFGVGKISFSGLFQGIGGLIDLVARIDEEEKGEVTREREFTSPSGRVKAVYGLSIKTNIAGLPTVETFGNVRETSGGSVIEDEREPLVDTFNEKDSMLLIAELPGVEQEQIHTDIEGDVLTLSASGGERKYRKEITLPQDVDTSTMQSTYKNGMLEIRMTKKQ